MLAPQRYWVTASVTQPATTEPSTGYTAGMDGHLFFRRRIALALFSATILAHAWSPLVVDRRVNAQDVIDRVTSVAPTIDMEPAEASAEQAVIRFQTHANQPTPSEWQVDGWDNYTRLWNELALDPENRSIRQYLGLPIGDARDESTSIRVSRGRSAPRWLGWRSGTYAQVETPHLQIFSHASREQTLEVAEDLEFVFWVWSQTFFPLWESREQVAKQLEGFSADESIADQLKEHPMRMSSRRKLRVVLLRDANDYAATLGAAIPGIEQSTGFYADERRTSFFYPSRSQDAVASRRHELVHQLFRECTRSNLGEEMPGESNDFWLVEGIAGYFESLSIRRGVATLGGWDSPRLQFARHRVFRREQIVALDELRGDGRLSAQRRGDLATFYAFAIAYTHALIDGESLGGRRWIMQTLADLYQVRLSVPDATLPESVERSLIDFLRVDDTVLENNPPSRTIRELCLAKCRVTGQGLSSLPESTALTWLDVTQLPITVQDLKRLLPRPNELQQLSVEATRVDDQLASWLQSAAQLNELDLSGLGVTDRLTPSLAPLRKLETLWMTQTQITDQSVSTFDNLKSLEFLDVQGTRVTDAAINQLRSKRPGIKVNGR
ncbi:MAG: hypothetical protein AAFV88_20930 [Planctomycetota bacterium]